MIIEIHGHNYSTHDFYHISPITEDRGVLASVVKELRNSELSIVGYSFILELRRGDKIEKKRFGVPVKANTTPEEHEAIKDKLEKVRQMTIDLWNESDQRIVLNMNNI